LRTQLQGSKSTKPPDQSPRPEQLAQRKADDQTRTYLPDAGSKANPNPTNLQFLSFANETRLAPKVVELFKELRCPLRVPHDDLLILHPSYPAIVTQTSPKKRFHFSIRPGFIVEYTVIP
jgi:hypothetical protein